MSTNNTAVDIYERLAAAQDALPHGFARTPSGVEIRLIKMAFSAEEVSLAGQLTRFPRPLPDREPGRRGRRPQVTADPREPDPRRLVRLDSPGHGSSRRDTAVRGR